MFLQTQKLAGKANFLQENQPATILKMPGVYIAFQNNSHPDKPKTTNRTITIKTKRKTGVVSAITLLKESASSVWEGLSDPQLTSSRARQWSVLLNQILRKSKGIGRFRVRKIRKVRLRKVARLRRWCF